MQGLHLGFPESCVHWTLLGLLMLDMDFDTHPKMFI